MNNRYEFMFFIEAKNCNPNGDPDMGNTPRIDPETMHGIITDVAIKRRIRNYIENGFNHKYGMDIIKREASNMNRAIAEAVLTVNDTEIDKKGNKKIQEASEYLCHKYFDVRTFGDVLTTGLNAGQVRGPVQIAIANSIDPISPIDMSITRMCYTDGDYITLEEYDIKDNEMPQDKKRTMGRKQIIPYGLYLVKGSISANLADKTGFNENDMKILFEAIMNMYSNDISASKMGMSVIAPMIIFKHVGTDSDEEQRIRESKLGCANLYVLHNLLEISRKPDVEYARDYKDYNVTLNYFKKPNGIEIGFKDDPFGDIIWNKEQDDWINIIKDNNGR